MKTFKVCQTKQTVSGLQQFLFIANDGECFQACGNPLRVREFPEDTVLNVPARQEVEDFLKEKGFELVMPVPATKGWNRKGQAPIAVLREVWPRSRRVVTRKAA